MLSVSPVPGAGRVSPMSRERSHSLQHSHMHGYGLTGGVAFPRTRSPPMHMRLDDVRADDDKFASPMQIATRPTLVSAPPATVVSAPPAELLALRMVPIAPADRVPAADLLSPPTAMGRRQGPAAPLVASRLSPAFHDDDEFTF
jgi:hypothetical protein